MTIHWTVGDLPGQSWAPEPPPDDDGEGPWCFYRDLWGQHIHPDHLTTMTTIQPAQEFL